MDYIGGVDGMNFTPINNYNKYLKETKALDVDLSSSDFESVLKQQSDSLQDSIKINGGVQLNKIDDEIAKNSIMDVSKDSPTGNFMNNMSTSINKGLNAVNDNIKAADRAQEAMAMGEDVSVHDVMIAAEKASLSLQMAMQLRNKVISAYTEINNIRV